jgi:hypothetical protein
MTSAPNPFPQPSNSPESSPDRPADSPTPQDAVSSDPNSGDPAPSESESNAPPPVEAVSAESETGDPAPSESESNAPPPVEAASAESEGDRATSSDETTSDASTETETPLRHHPIPPPSEPRQYRAIGLVRGQYVPSADRFTRGVLVTDDDTPIDAVLLGRIMSLVKNHLDLQQHHLWVVYPRIRQPDGGLHVQIVGVWEPETLKPAQAQPTSESDSVSSTETIVSSDVDRNYFSVRGEVIFQSQDEEYAIVKIKQSPRKGSDRPKFFKLKVEGLLPGKAVRHFWDLHLRRTQNALIVQEARDLGFIPSKPRKKFAKGKGKRFGRGNNRPSNRGRSSAPVKKSSGSDRPRPSSPSSSESSRSKE